MAVCISIPLGAEVGLSLGDIVLDRDPAPPPPKGHNPQFSANVRCGETAGWSKIPLGMEVGLGPGEFVFDRDPCSYPQKGHSPTQLLAHACCGQTAGWIKMPLGTEVNLDPGDVVLDGIAAGTPPLKGAIPVFGPCLLWPNGCLDEDATWYGSRPRPRPHCVRRGPSSPRERGTAAPRPCFRPMSVVATVAHLSCC